MIEIIPRDLSGMVRLTQGITVLDFAPDLIEVVVSHHSGKGAVVFPVGHVDKGVEPLTVDQSPDEIREAMSRARLARMEATNGPRTHRP
jgi:hypothetical protein